MQITVFAIRFKDGAWKEYQHICSPVEGEAVLESAKAKAFERYRYQTPQYADYLAGASYIFNVARGAEDRPAEGDTVVFGVQVDEVVVRHTMSREQLIARR